MGGAEKLMTDLLPRLQQMGHEVDIYVFSGVQTPLVEQLKSSGVRVLMGRENDSVYHPKHIRVLRKLMPQYDIVHSHNTSPQLFAALANIGRNTTLVTTEHNTTNRRRQLVFFRPIDLWMYRQYRQIIFVSEPCKMNMQAYLPDLSESSMCVISNGIDTHRFAQATVSAEYNHQTIQASHILINVSGFRAQKDQPTIIRAMQLLPSDYHLLLVGDGDCISSCKQLTKALGLEHRIHFLGIRTDVPELLQAADVVLMSSHYEGLALSNLEGMAADKPFVASDVDGLREIVGGYGVLFPHENYKALAAEIKKLCDDPKYAAAIAARCQQRASEFDISKTVAGYDAVYKEVIANNK